MSKELFGTDGIRGVAGQYPLDAPTVHAFGVALGEVAAGLAEAPEVVLGIDTRESGPQLAEQVCGGLSRHRVRVRYAGVITTPGVAYLTRTDSFVAGVMISASHNPYQDNGIKVFSHSGYKLDDEQERHIERRIFATLAEGLEPVSGAVEADPALGARYLGYLCSASHRPFQGLSVVVDCGNGAASQLAPQLLERLGARVQAMASAPDGRNINLGCGALHPEALVRRVTETGADLGVAFDGDADRAIFVSRTGKVVNGDGVLLLTARWLLGQGQLKGPGGEPLVVATVMSNLGLERALERYGVRLLRTPVGDKYVLEGMLRTGAVLGGEQSGHVIFRDYATTGDGLLTAVRVMEIIVESGLGLDELTAELRVYPQRLLNVRVRERKKLADIPAVAGAIHAAEAAFGSAGRVLVRYSGTEPLARVMVEGPEASLVEAHAQLIADAIRQELGE